MTTVSPNGNRPSTDRAAPPADGDPRLTVSHGWRLTAAAAAATGLATLTLSPTVTSGPWLGQSLLVTGVVAVVAGLARSRRLPGVAVLVLSALAAVGAVTALFVREAAWLGVVPGPATWPQFAALAEEGAATLWEQAPPVTATPGISLLIVAGVALVAVVVDAVAATWRHAAAAGVPLLVLYLVPAAVLPDGVPWPLFVLAATGWLLLLLADGTERLSRWGRTLTGSTAHPFAALGATGRRLAVGSLALAVAVPMLVPVLGDGVLSPGGGGDGSGDDGTGDAAGFRRIVTVNPIVDLRRNLRQPEDIEVIRYTTSDPSPQYLRIATLDQFNGKTWTLEEMEAGADQRVVDGLPSPPGLTEPVSRREVTSEIEVLGLDTPRLPLPYPASRVIIEGDWRYDADSFDVFTPTQEASALGQTYQADSLDVIPTAAQLEAAGPVPEELQEYLQLPEDLADDLVEVSAPVTAGAQTPYQAALALQTWFRTEFEYSIEPAAGNSETALATFLADRSGYCEQFAATMALLARAEGIPSRVQVGFTPGTRADDGTWSITLQDAHAWPELWFTGVGWVRFEPTPGGGAGGGTPAWAPPPIPGLDPGAGGQQEGEGPTLRRGGETPLDDPDAPGRRPDGRPDRSGGELDPATGLPLDDDAGGRGGLATGLVLALVALVALAPALTSRLLRRRRWAGAHDEPTAVVAAWTDVLTTARDLDLDPRPTETPRDLARRLPRQAGIALPDRERLARLADAVERARYAAPGPPAGGPGAAAAVSRRRDEAEHLVAALLVGQSPRERRRARWWPASGRDALAAWAGRGGQWVDRRWGAWRLGVSGRLRRAGAPSALPSDS